MKWILLVFAAAVLLLGAGALVGAGDIVWAVMTGWIAFVRHTFPRATVNPPAVVSGVVIFVLFIAVVEGFGRWCCRGVSRATGQRRRWHLRWTVSIVVTVFLMFAVGYCAIGLARQTAWALSSPEPLRGEWLSGSPYRPYYNTHCNMEWMGKGFVSYRAERKELPPGGTFDAQGNMLHSWETAILPYIYVENKIDMKLPWNDPANAVYFKSIVPEFINMDFRTQKLTDDEGYGLSHYAANSRVLRANAAAKPEEIPGGASGTILIGEVNHAFRPWGYPANWRDPATGINRPNGFGGATQSRGAGFS